MPLITCNTRISADIPASPQRTEDARKKSQSEQNWTHAIHLRGTLKALQPSDLSDRSPSYRFYGLPKKLRATLTTIFELQDVEAELAVLVDHASRKNIYLTPGELTEIIFSNQGRQNKAKAACDQTIQGRWDAFLSVLSYLCFYTSRPKHSSNSISLYEPPSYWQLFRQEFVQPLTDTEKNRPTVKALLEYAQSDGFKNAVLSKKETRAPADGSSSAPSVTRPLFFHSQQAPAHRQPPLDPNSRLLKTSHCLPDNKR